MAMRKITYDQVESQVRKLAESDDTPEQLRQLAESLFQAFRRIDDLKSEVASLRRKVDADSHVV